MAAVPTALPRQRADESYSGVDVHPAKVEIFDLSTMTNTDPKGVVRRVDEYRVEPFGLYMARPVVNRPSMRYLESWLLPEFGLRVSDWHFAPGYERDQDFYLDIADIRPGGRYWRTTDLYLDIVLRTGRGLEVLDTDELLAATNQGLLDHDSSQCALEITYRTVQQLATHGYDLARWLATEGIELTWQRR